MIDIAGGPRRSWRRLRTVAWMRSDSDRELFFKLLSPGPQDRILDVGAGKGVVARRVLASGAGEVYAIEPDEKRVVAMKRFSSELKSYASGVEKMPFPDSFFSKVYTTMAVHHFTDLDGGLREIARVLKQGGALLILDIDPSYGRGRILRFFENGVLRRNSRFLKQSQLVGKLEAAGDFEVSWLARVKSGYLIQCIKIGGAERSSALPHISPRRGFWNPS